MEKNQLIELSVTDITAEGQGVGHHEGMAVFVPFTAVGDRIRCRIVKVLKNYAYGIIDEILTFSPYRCEPLCPQFKKCGGCAFWHFSYEEELRRKENFVRAAFARIGKLDVPFSKILGCERTVHYRNKAQYPVGTDENGQLICGFYSRRSHRVVDATACALQPPVFGEITKAVLRFCNDRGVSGYNEITGKGLLRHIYLRRGEHSGEILLCLVVTDTDAFDFSPLSEVIQAAFPEVVGVILNENKRNTNVILGNTVKTVWGQPYITDTMCTKSFRISPLSFYQVNTVQAERLYEIARKYANLQPGETLLDLYCGVGTIGLSLTNAENHLIGGEIVPEAVENARQNAVRNGITHAEYLLGDAGKIAQKLMDRGVRPDVIVADPARKGCDALSIASMLALAPRRIVMISCNPATAARDCAALVKGGYTVEAGQAVDLFPRTTHVETVALLSRQKVTEHIYIDVNIADLPKTTRTTATYLG